jgi:hypothetical protein
VGVDLDLDLGFVHRTELNFTHVGTDPGNWNLESGIKQVHSLLYDLFFCLFFLFCFLELDVIYHNHLLGVVWVDCARFVKQKKKKKLEGRKEFEGMGEEKKRGGFASLRRFLRRRRESPTSRIRQTLNCSAF